MAALSREAQIPQQTPARYLLLQLAIIFAYLDLAFYIIPRDFFEYKFAQFLFDYSHGIARRSLEGEVLRRLVPPPYSIELFGHIAGVQVVAVFVLFAMIVWVAAKRSRNGSRFAMAMLVVSSPTTFKNLIFDGGRQDCMGVMALEISILLGLMRSGSALSVFLCVATLPLALINENLLLLYLPACLAIHGCRLLTDRHPDIASRLPGFLGIGPFAILAASYLICLALPHPSISQAAYHRYLQGKSLQEIDQCDPERWLYSNASDNFTFARAEWTRLSHFQVASAGQYVAFLLILAFTCWLVAASVRETDEGICRLYMASIAAILPGYVVLFIGASDIARWFSNMNFSIMLFSLWYLSWSNSEPRPKVWIPAIPIAGAQLLLMGGFGIVYPNFTIAGDLHRIAALF